MEYFVTRELEEEREAKLYASEKRELERQTDRERERERGEWRIPIHTQYIPNRFPGVGMYACMFLCSE